MQITTIDLLRHGAVAGGTYYRGRTDDPLSEQGWQQMRYWASQTRPWTQLVSSPLCRCKSFAIELSEQTQLPLKIDPAWQELDFGDWEGKTAAEITQYDPDALTLFYQNPEQNPPPRGEKITVFQQRVNDAWQQVISEFRGESVLVVCHAGVIRTLFCQLLNIPQQNRFAVAVDYASLTRFVCYHTETGDFVMLEFHNVVENCLAIPAQAVF